MDVFVGNLLKGSDIKMYMARTVKYVSQISPPVDSALICKHCNCTPSSHASESLIVMVRQGVGEHRMHVGRLPKVR